MGKACCLYIYETDLQKRPMKEKCKKDLWNRRVKETYETEVQKRPMKQTCKRDL